MDENVSPQMSLVPELQTRLKDIVRRLRQPGSLDAESQQTLAGLVDEMTAVLRNAHLPAAELTHLAQTTAHLEDTLQYHQDQGTVGKARAGLERVVSSAETSAPLAVGLARRLLEVLANIGI